MVLAYQKDRRYPARLSLPFFSFILVFCFPYFTLRLPFLISFLSLLLILSRYIPLFHGLSSHLLVVTIPSVPVTSPQGPDGLSQGTFSLPFLALPSSIILQALPSFPPPDLGLTRKGSTHDLSKQLMLRNMSSINFYLDNDERAPEVSLYNHDWADWVGLNADTRKVPLGARAWKDLSTVKWDTAEVTPSGRYAELEWTKQPDWYRHEAHWRGFGPTRMDTPHSVETPWYFDMDTPVAYSVVPGSYSFADLQRGKADNELNFLDDCLAEVVATQQFLEGSPVPPPYDRKHLATTFQSVIALQREGAAVKRAAWDRVAFLAWWTAACNDWSKGVDVITAERVEHIVSKGREPRGFLFDLLTDWRELNVPFLLSRGVPFYYTFSLEARLNERFCRLNPKILASYAGPNGDEVVIHDIDDEDNLREAERATCRYDDFFPAVGS